MGLDMFLNGYKYLLEEDRKEDGYPICGIEIRLGYWRKGHKLHNYIVNEFAEGKDNCQEIPLNLGHLRQIRAFTEDKPTMHIIDGAIKWLQEEGGIRSVIYQARW